MRYRELLSILESYPKYNLRACVGRFILPVTREYLLKEMQFHRGTKYRIEVEIDHDVKQLTLHENA